MAQRIGDDFSKNFSFNEIITQPTKNDWVVESGKTVNKLIYDKIPATFQS